jgi:hypothetical protein
MLIGNF